MTSIRHFFSQDSKEITFLVPKSYRLDSWLDNYGAVENVLTNLPKQTRIVRFDLSNCEWCDPMSVLSILMTCVRLKFENLIVFLSVCNYELDNSKSRKQFYSFLYCEGFFKVMHQQGILVVNKGGKAISLSEPETKYQANVLFKESGLINPIVYNLVDFADKDGTTISSELRRVVDNARHRLKDKIPERYRNDILNSIFLYLNETVTNIFEHAYESSVLKLAVIYVRFRYGIFSEKIDRYERERLIKAFNEESLYSTNEEKFSAELNKGFIEVFVLDSGRGLLSSFPNVNRPKKYSLQHCLNEVLFYGNRNSERPKPTKFGGLYILTRLIRNGYLWLKEANEIFSENLPIVKNVVTKESKSNYPPKGLPLVARLFWKQHEKNENWINATSLDKGKCYISSLSNHTDFFRFFLKKRFNEIRYNPICVRDERYSFLRDKIFPKGYLNISNQCVAVLLLPKVGKHKNEIFKYITDELKGRNPSGRIAIVADIEDSEAELYAFAIENAKVTEDILNNYDQIVLVSRKLDCYILAKDRFNPKAFLYSRKMTEDFILRDPAGLGNFDSLFHLLVFLKSHDSMIYWRYVLVKQFLFGKLFIKGKIKWPSGGNEYVLNNYFDFTSSLTVQPLNDIYEIVLSRVACLMSEGYDRIESSDNLVRYLVDRFNNMYGRSSSDFSRAIVLNSVWTTGLTEMGVREMGSDISLNVFKNGIPGAEETDNNINCLFLWPDSAFIDLDEKRSELPWARVGASPFIAPNGWKYFTIPRYKHRRYSQIPINDAIKELSARNEEIADKDFLFTTGVSPRDTYDTIQTPGVFSIGHFEYRGYHDLIKFDIPYAFDESRDLNGELFLFVLNHIMNSFQIPYKSIENDSILTEKVKNYRKKILSQGRSRSGKNVDIVVYPYHYTTEYIFRAIRGIIPDTYHERIIPLMPLSSGSSYSSSFYSPLTLEHIKKIAKRVREGTDEIVDGGEGDTSRSNVSALFFDTVRINAKTERETKHILKLCGVDDFESVILLDRSRMPLHETNLEKSSSFWRLDVPILGSNGNCEICRALEVLRTIKNELFSRLIVDRLEEIISCWVTKYRYTANDEGHGIPSVSIALPDEGKKRFGVYVKGDETLQLGGEGNKIRLVNSYGIAMFCIEVLSMTSRDDIIFDMIRDDQLDYRVVVTTMCSILLTQKNLVSPNSRRRMIHYLVSEFIKREVCDEYSSVAAIVLIANPELACSAMFDYKNEGLSPNFEITNTDILIAACAISRIIKSEWLESERLIRISITANVQGNIGLREFHRILYNDFGESHSLPLQKIVEGEDINLEQARDAFSALCVCRGLIERLDVLYLIEAFREEPASEWLKKIDAFSNELRDRLSDYYFSFSNVKKMLDRVKEEGLIKLFKDIFREYAKIHESLFAKYSFEENGRFRVIEELGNIIEECQKLDGNLKILYKSSPPVPHAINLKKRWVPWNSTVVRILEDFLGDTRHNHNKIKDKENPGEFDRIVSCFSEEKYYVVIFSNLCEQESIREAGASFRTKKANSELYLRSMGGEINLATTEISENSLQMLQIIIKLPYM